MRIISIGPICLLASILFVTATYADENKTNTSAITLDHGLKHHAYIPTADGRKPHVVSIFIGGADENKTKNNLQNSDAFNKNVIGDNYYADYTQAAQIDSLIKALPKDTLINMFGVREGSLTAGKIVLAHPQRITYLATLDPVGYTFPNVAEIKSAVKFWSDYTQDKPGSTPAKAQPSPKPAIGH